MEKIVPLFHFHFDLFGKFPGFNIHRTPFLFPSDKKIGREKYYLNLLTNSTTATSEITASIPSNPGSGRLRVRVTVIGPDEPTYNGDSSSTYSFFVSFRI